MDRGQHLALLLLLPPLLSAPWPAAGAESGPLVIGHRGSCGALPEHTLASYTRAIQEGAHAVECDVVMTKDSVPICRHEPNIVDTTNVKDHPKFADRRRTYKIDGVEMTGFFSVDFTLEEIKQLRAVQRLSFRDPSYDSLFEVPTLREYLDLVLKNTRGQPVGIYVETKHPQWHRSLGLEIEDKLLELLDELRVEEHRGTSFLESFDAYSLRLLKERTKLPLVQLLEIDWTERDYNFSGAARPESRSPMELLDNFSVYADAIGPAKESLVAVEPKTRRLGNATDLVQQAHKRGLLLHAYTFRNENQFLAFDYGQDPLEEYALFLEHLHVDGVFSDFPGTATSYLELVACRVQNVSPSSMPSSKDLHCFNVPASGSCGVVLFAAASQVAAEADGAEDNT
eukprot:SM000007S20808  [mRNA]  locus=s7:375309:378038:+ [translate_table: standard]